MKTEPCTVEWSKSQQCFHVDFLELTLRRNRECFFEGYKSDWILVGLANSIKEASAMANAHKSAKSKINVSKLASRLTEEME